MIAAIDDAVIVGLLSAFTGIAVAVIGYRYSRKVDKATEHSGEVDQIIAGQNILIRNLVNDNKELRRRINNVEQRLEAKDAVIEQLRTDVEERLGAKDVVIDELRRSLAALEGKFGVTKEEGE